MVRIGYTSQSRIDGSMRDRLAVLTRICRVSSANNATRAISGTLILDRMRFYQVLEGERGPVEETLRRIKRDTRHTNVVLLGEEPIRSRAFHDWQMAGLSRAPSLARLFEAYGFTLHTIPTTMTLERITSLGQAVREIGATAG